MTNVWTDLSRFDVSSEVKTKGRFDYLSWTWAWAFVKEKYPSANFEKHIFRDNQDNPLPFMRDTKGHTYVAVTVTIEGLSHTEIMPVMDHKNQSIPHPDGMQVNKAHQRTLVKALAFHGLGINVYAGEDLPLDLDEPDHQGIIAKFHDANSVEEIDQMWRDNAQNIAGLGKVAKGQVTDAFKAQKNKLKSA